MEYLKREIRTFEKKHIVSSSSTLTMITTCRMQSGM